MISSVRSNMPSFKEVEFNSGFNIVLADRTMESTRRDSRNGLGKTTLIEIIHFCLGAQARRNQGLLVDPLKGWNFTLEMKTHDRALVVTRSTDEPNRVDLNQSQGGMCICRVLGIGAGVSRECFGPLTPGLGLRLVNPRFHEGRLCRATARTSTPMRPSGAGRESRPLEICAWGPRPWCSRGSATSWPDWSAGETR